MTEERVPEVSDDAGLEIPETPETPEALRARRLVRTSWLMLPLLLVSTLVAVLFAILVGAFTDVDAIDPLAEQGVLGWLVFIVSNLVLWPLPSYFGLRFALQAQRLGGSAFVPLVAHGFVLAAIWALALIAVVREL